MTVIEANKDVWASFQQLGSFTHLYKPQASTSATRSDPGLIIICAWAFAYPRHISKYLKNYQERYPTSQILVLQTDTGNMIWRPEAWQVPMFTPAVQAIHDFISNEKTSSGGVLLHLFSNGGCHTAVQLGGAYHHFSSQDLPVNAIIFDSCPTNPHFQIGIKAMSMGLPKTTLARTFGVPLLYLTLGMMVILQATGISELFIAKAYRQLKSPSSPFTRRNVPRTYIYSETDAVIPVQDVLNHAKEAEEIYGGASKVRVEEFVGSMHVNHMSTDPERYWRIVRETWEEAVGEDVKSGS